MNSHINSLNIKKIRHITLEIQVLNRNKHNNLAVFNQLDGPQPSSSW